MAYTDIDFPAEFFNTVLYTGNGSTQTITGVGFQPDFTWIKGRTGYGNSLYDVIRTYNYKILSSDSTSAEATETGGVSSVASDGFNLIGNNTIIGGTNPSGEALVAWNWKANGAGVSNTDGTITSTVSANTDSGFSVVTYTGNNTSSSTVGHGLGVAPSMVICKNRTTGIGSGSWATWHTGLSGGNYYLFLNSTAAQASGNNNFTAAPTSTVLNLGTSDTNNTADMVAYCFAEKKGFSKFGSYVGNGGNQFIYTGFKPAFVLEKRSSNASTWIIHDNKRNTYNPVTKSLFPNTSGSEATYAGVNFLSNGYQAQGTLNDSGQTLIYMAFAEHPFVTSTSVPTTAR